MNHPPNIGERPGEERSTADCKATCGFNGYRCMVCTPRTPFEAALNKLGMKPSEYARVTGQGENQIHCRARGVKATSGEVVLLIRALAKFKSGAAKLRTVDAGADPG